MDIVDTANNRIDLYQDSTTTNALGWDNDVEFSQYVKKVKASRFNSYSGQSVFDTSLPSNTNFNNSSNNLSNANLNDPQVDVIRNMNNSNLDLDLNAFSASTNSLDYLSTNNNSNLSNSLDLDSSMMLLPNVANSNLNNNDLAKNLSSFPTFDNLATIRSSINDIFPGDFGVTTTTCLNDVTSNISNINDSQQQTFQSKLLRSSSVPDILLCHNSNFTPVHESKAEFPGPSFFKSDPLTMDSTRSQDSFNDNHSSSALPRKSVDDIDGLMQLDSFQQNYQQILEQNVNVETNEGFVTQNHSESMSNSPTPIKRELSSSLSMPSLFDLCQPLSPPQQRQQQPMTPQPMMNCDPWSTTQLSSGASGHNSWASPITSNRCHQMPQNNEGHRSSPLPMSVSGSSLGFGSKEFQPSTSDILEDHWAGSNATGAVMSQPLSRSASQFCIPNQAATSPPPLPRSTSQVNFSAQITDLQSLTQGRFPSQISIQQMSENNLPTSTPRGRMHSYGQHVQQKTNVPQSRSTSLTSSRSLSLSSSNSVRVSPRTSITTPTLTAIAPAKMVNEIKPSQRIRIPKFRKNYTINKRFTCTEADCDRMFSTISSLNNHLRSKHATKPESKSKIKKIVGI